MSVESGEVTLTKDAYFALTTFPTFAAAIVAGIFTLWNGFDGVFDLFDGQWEDAAKNGMEYGLGVYVTRGLVHSGSDAWHAKKSS